MLLEIENLTLLYGRIEALHYDFASQSDRFVGIAPSSIPSAAWKGLDSGDTVVRAGISLRFN